MCARLSHIPGAKPDQERMQGETVTVWCVVVGMILLWYERSVYKCPGLLHQACWGILLKFDKILPRRDFAPIIS